MGNSFSGGVRFDGTAPRAGVGQGTALGGNRFQGTDANARLNASGIRVNPHGDWYHGTWHGNWNVAANHVWSDHPGALIAGTALWGRYRIANRFGYYGGYLNPFVTVGDDGDGIVSYADPLGDVSSDRDSSDALGQPVGDETPDDAALLPGPPAPGEAEFEAARNAFFSGDLDAALTQVNESLKSLPNDAAVHEFRSLVLFAQGKYRDASAGVYAVLAVGPGWDWTTLVGLYPSVSVYTDQLRALETWMKQNVQLPEGHFLLAYHYLTQGHNDAALRQFKQTLELTPNDAVVKQYIAMLAGTATPAGVTPSTTVTADAKTPAVVIAPEQILGEWKADGSRGEEYHLTLTADSLFQWTYARGGKTETVNGSYSLDGDSLALQPAGGGVMVARLTSPSDDAFHFTMLGGDDNDPGLEFRK